MSWHRGIGRLIALEYAALIVGVELDRPPQSTYEPLERHQGLVSCSGMVEHTFISRMAFADTWASCSQYIYRWTVVKGDIIAIDE